MEENKLKEFWIQNDSLLIDSIENYFSNQGDFMIPQDINYSVGKIVHVGKELDPELVGRICYYHKNIGSIVNLKEYGRYTVITENTLLIIKPKS